MFTSMMAAIIASEIVSVLISFILLYGTLFESREQSAKKRRYTALIATNIIVLLTDVVSWLLNGRQELQPVIVLCTVLSLLLSFLLMSEFILYFSACIYEKTKVTLRIGRVFYVSCAAGAVITLAAISTGNVFSFSGAVYEYGSLYFIYLVINAVCCIFCFIIIILHGRVLGRHDFSAFFIYMLIPGLSLLMSLVLDSWDFSYSATTISLTVLYVMIQSEKASRLEQEGRINSFYASHDELTGLLNRRAYEERLQKLSEEQGQAAVVFGDLNGLKYANDHFGHTAGDELLIRFSGLLREIFPHQDIFRISGDEFVVLLADVSTEKSAELMEACTAKLSADETEIAVIGSSYGLKQDVIGLVQAAEAEMYKKKEIFHREHPELIR